MRLAWNADSQRTFDAGLDRGVLYPKSTPPLGPIVATNLVVDPHLASSTALGTYNGAVKSSVAAPYAKLGTNVERVVAPAGGLVKNQQFLMAKATGLVTTASMKFSVRIWVRATPGAAGLPFEYDLKAYQDTTQIGDMDVSHIKVFEDDEWTTLTIPAVSFADAPFNIIGFKIFPQATLPEGEGLELGGYSVVMGNTAVDPFAGDSEDTSLYQYAWTGAEADSTSTKRELISLATPWNGLISVDENGADSAVTYYVDGRPYLTVPKPKEFAGTIKAYTYPDAFAEIVGLVEAADNMFADSQQGDSFDLSYRTLVGNDVDGIDHGYKIHLVYNATASPTGMSYESISDSLTPVEFTWDITAVPVPLAGFRPTAHIIVDTRDIDPDILLLIEGMLYGDENHNPGMPDPSVISELLSFGSAIVIVDNGDDTWSATGSYHNVYFTDDGVFEIDNVNAVDNGDGTYTVSSTP